MYTRILSVSIIIVFIVLSPDTGFSGAEQVQPMESQSSVNMVRAAWEALEAEDYEEVLRLTQVCVDQYAKRAKQMQEQLKDYVSGPEAAIRAQWALNDVSAALFIRGRAQEKTGQFEEAKASYRQIIESYFYGQCWDPKGWFWKPAYVAKDRLAALESGVEYNFGDYSSATLVNNAWQALEKEDFNRLHVFADKSIQLYQEKAKEMQEKLDGFPQGADEELFQFWALNDVATAHFIKGRAFLLQGNKPEAKKEFELIRDELSFAQCWDPRGWWWKVAQEANNWLRTIEQDRLKEDVFKEKI